MIYRHLTSRHWTSNLGSFNPVLSKGPTSTTWIWNLHATPHDFILNTGLTNKSTSHTDISRKVLSSGAAHVSIILMWISGMLFHGSYFSNYIEWLRDPTHVKPSAHFVWSLVGQDILNSDVGGYFQGIYISSGLFHMWRAQGIVSYTQLKCASLVSLIVSIAFLAIAFYIMHLYPINSASELLTYKNVILLLGLASISWSAHIVHIASPTNRLLDAGIDPTLLVSPQDLLSRDVLRNIIQGFGQTSILSLECLLPTNNSYSIVGSVIYGYTDPSGSISMEVIAAHHLYLGLAMITSGLLIRPQPRATSSFRETLAKLNQSWHAQLSLALALSATLSFIQAHNVYSYITYPYIGCDYPTQVSLYTHHMWIGGFLMVGHGAHASLAFIVDFHPTNTPAILRSIISHRDIIIGHLVWVVIFLGFHSFGLYIHNDSLQALGRPEDTFSDSAIQLKPIFSTLAGFSLDDLETSTSTNFLSIGSKIYSAHQVLGTSDFMIHHIHAFTIHTTVLIILKGSMYSRSSRLVSDKHNLGFRYPCDGPGRGGTCQISPWDHIFLALFWMYNSISILIFHFFWKMQSDVWGSFDSSGTPAKVSHLTSGDFASNSNSVNGWLRTFLWSESAQVIQSYSTSLSGYGLVFLGSHLIWAFSLMFLYSGRGYWQELIESIVWAHHKLKLTPQIQPRALSISQGRAVGVSHYILGGIGCTWSFFISRMVALSY